MGIPSNVTKFWHWKYFNLKLIFIEIWPLRKNHANLLLFTTDWNELCWACNDPLCKRIWNLVISENRQLLSWINCNLIFKSRRKLDRTKFTLHDATIRNSKECSCNPDSKTISVTNRKTVRTKRVSNTDLNWMYLIVYQLIWQQISDRWTHTHLVSNRFVTVIFFM